MGVLARFAKIMEANINALLDKAEDPEKMIDQTLRDLQESLAEVKKETAGVMAEEKRCRRIVDEKEAAVDKWTDLAKKAVAAGNDGDARTFIGKKQAAETELIEAQKAHALAEDNASKVRQMHDKLVKDIGELNSKRATLKAKVSVAKTQERLNKVTSGSKAAGTMAAMDELESRIDARLDRANAEAELNQQPVDEADALASKYENGASAGSVDAELAALKAEMGV